MKNGKEIFYYKNGNKKCYTEYYNNIKINNQYFYDINGKMTNCINHTIYSNYERRYT